MPSLCSRQARKAVLLYPGSVDSLPTFLCERHERVVGHDNRVSFEGLKLQIPVDRHRCHYVKARVTVLRYPNRQMAILHGPRRLATYDALGKEIKLNNTVSRKSAATTAQ